MPTILRPMSTGELLDRTFTLYRKHFLLFVGIIALPNLAHLALQFVMMMIQPPPAGRFDFSLILSQLPWMLSNFIVYVLVLAASQGATVVAVSDVHLEKPVSVAGSFGAIIRRIPYLSWVMLVVWFGILLGCLFLIVPGILLALMWSLTIPVVVLENTSATEAMSRSARLTKGNRGRIFLVYLVFAAVMYAVNMIWEMPLIFFLFANLRTHPNALPSWFQVYAVVGSFFTQCLVGPLLTIAIALIYYDERVRKEGFDLQYMISSLQTQPPAGLTAASSGQ